MRAVALALLAAVVAGCAAGEPRQAAPPAEEAPRTVALDEWRYRPASSARWRTVTLPHSANPVPVRGPDGARNWRGSRGWYERVVEVARPGLHELRFGSAHHRAVVFIDGRLAGRHTGAYEPFAVRARLTGGPHRVTVRVDWRDPERQQDEGFRRLWFNFGGLNGEAELERIEGGRLGEPWIRTRLLGDRAEVEVRVAGAARGRLERDGVRLGWTGPRGVVTVPRAQLWAPGDPKLWRLTAEGPAGARLERDVGLRELRWDGGRLRVNGRPVRLKGASLPADAPGHGDAFDAGDRRRLVDHLRAIGANATRSQRPLDGPMLQALDAAGILLWLEVAPFEPGGGWWARTARRREVSTRRTLAAVRRSQAHASVVAWSLANEAMGQGHPKGQAGWIDATARRIRRLDPGRPVVADLWGKHLAERPGRLHRSLDGVGVTDYHGWYERPFAPKAEQERLARARVRRAQRLVPGGLVVVTELGAGGQPAARGLGGLAAQAELLGRRLRTFGATPGLDGALVWNLRDFALRPDFDGGSITQVAPGVLVTDGLLDKGLFDAAGTAKPAADAVRRAFAAWR